MRETAWSKRVSVCLFLFALVASSAAGRGAPGEDRHDDAAVICVRELRPHDQYSDRFGLNSVIRIEVRNLNGWEPAKTAPYKLIPYIGDIAVKGTHPLAVDLNAGTVIFHLRRDGDDPETGDPGKAWSQLLKNPIPWRPTRPVNVTVGTEGGLTLPIDKSKYVVTPAPRLVVFPAIGWVFLALDVLAIVGFVVVARRSNILRDTDADLPPDAAAGSRKPYSLGRTQLAVWFFAVLTAFIGLWVVTGDHRTLTASALGLLGISSGTFVTAALIDTNKQGRRATLTLARQRLDGEIDELSSRVDAAAADQVQAAELAQLQAKLAEQRLRRDQLNAELQAMQTYCQPSRGFAKDILVAPGGSGVSLHRFQIAAWTVVLVAIFLISTYTTLAMPEFGAELLMLMGISSGTYLLLKPPESRPAT